MSLRNARGALVAGALALALGAGFPAVALGEEGTGDTGNENQPALIEGTDNEGTDLGVSGQGKTVPTGNETGTDNGGTVEGQTTTGGTVTDNTTVPGGDTQNGEEIGGTENGGAENDDTENDGAGDDTTEGGTIADDTTSTEGETSDDDVTDDSTDNGFDEVEQEQAVVDDAPQAATASSVAEPSLSLATQSTDPKRNVADGTYEFSTRLKTPMVLDTKDGARKTGANVQLWTSNGRASQKWDVRYVSNGLYRILLHGTKLALSVKSAGTTNGTNVQLATQNNARAQLWKFVADSGFYYIVSALKDNYVVTVPSSKASNGTNVVMWAKANASNRQFKLYRADYADPSNVTLANGTYAVRPKDNTSYSLDVAGGSKADGANVQLYRSTSVQRQKFYFLSDHKGYYFVFVVGSGKVLTVDNASVMPGNNVKQATYKSGDETQKWSVQKNADGSYALVNKATRLAVAIYGNGYANGNNVKAAFKNNATNQKLTLARTYALNNDIYTISSAKATGNVFDTRNSNDYSLLKLASAANTLSQRFEVQKVSTTDGSERYRIRTAGSGGWLTVVGSTVRQVGDHRTVPNDRNCWNLIWNGTYFSLKNVSSGKVLYLAGGKATHGNRVDVYDANKNSAQHFYFTPSNLILNGTYVIASDVEGTNLALTQSGRNYCYVGTKNGKETQRYILRATNSTSDIYVLTNKYKNYVLTGESNDKVLLKTKTGAANQKWRAQITDGGCVMFVNVATGRALGIKGGSDDAKNGTLSQLYKPSQNPPQRWKLTPIEWRITGGKYYFYDTEGKASTWNKSSYQTWNRIKNLTSGTKYLAGVDQGLVYTNWYIRQGGLWVPFRSWRCVVGNEHAGNATPNGLFHTTGKKYYVSEPDDTVCYYWTVITAPALAFHSVMCYYGTYQFAGGPLGNHLSAGCVRLALENAKWVYDNIHRGTTVLIYS